jgi:hypothetical protein
MATETQPASKRSETLLLALSLVPAALVARPILEKIPLHHDHATHVFKVWHFWTELVPSGRLRGFSHYWGFGFPSDELVPCGGELWVGLFRLLTFGQLSWLKTYALAFAGLMFFKSYAAFRLGRHFFGRATGVIAAWLTLLDPGAMLEGGWEWHTDWGVWPVTLAASFFALALVRLDRLLSEGRAREVAAAGGLVAAALVTHQIALVALMLTAPLLFITRRLQKEPPRWFVYLAAVAALLFGFCLAGFFLVPFFTHTADTLDLGWLHEPLVVVVERLVLGKTFQNLAAPLHFLGLAGIVLGLYGRAHGGRFFAAAALACVLLASDVLVRTLHLERVLPGLVKFEVNRLLLVAKLFWFPLVGYALSALARLLSELFRRAGLGPNGVRVALAVAFASPLLLPVVRTGVAAHFEKRVVGAAELPEWADFQRFIVWSRAVRARTSEHYRVAYELWRGNHLPTILPVFDQTLLYKAGTTPTQIFKNLPRAPDPELYVALSVKYVVATAPLRDPSFRLIERFGGLFVHEFTRYRKEPFTLLGKGRGELVEFSPERIRIRLADTTPGTRLKLHVASYSRWRARQAGQELPIATVPVYEFRYPFLMEVPVGDGELVFEYVQRPADVAGLLLSMLALPGFFAALWFGRRQSEQRARLARAIERSQKPAGFFAIVLLSAIVAVVLLRTRSRRALLPPDSLFQKLEGRELRFAGKACENVEPLVFRCGPERVEAEVVSAAIWGVHLCMHAPRHGRLVLSKELTLGSFLAGSYDSVTRQSSGSVRVAIDGQELAKFATEPPYLQQQFVQFDTRARRGQKALVEIELDGSAVDCFDFRLLR